MREAPSRLFQTKGGLSSIFAAVLGAALLLTLATLLLLLAAHSYHQSSAWQASFLVSIDLSLQQQQQQQSTPPFDGAGTRILKLLSKNGSSACHHARTHGVVAVGLPVESGKPLRLRTGHPFTFRILSVTENGTRRCAGGDFYETQLEGMHWMSRPPVVDMDDGTYSITISVDEGFPGMYKFAAVLLFDNMHGLDFDPRKWGIQKEVLKLQVEMIDTDTDTDTNKDADTTKTQHKLMNTDLAHVNLHGELPDTRQCVDAGSEAGGRWTRSWYNRTCEADKEGRYKWCTDEKNAGKAALLESNGWIFSKSSCSFKIWEAGDAWQCLQGRWLLFWGDSNLQDAISNLLFYILGFRKRPRTDRISHKLYTNPQNSTQSVLISLVFNGHHNASRNSLGLASLRNSSYRRHIEELYHTGHPDGFMPDAIIITAGLHDAEHFVTAADFSMAVDYAGDFWRHLLINDESGSMNGQQRTSHGLQRYPIMVLRTAVTPAGEARVRAKQANPQKMEAFNAIMIERFSRKLEKGGVRVHVLDTFDATFPFHFDHNYSDGLHYGREPKSKLLPWFGHPHHYFVDIMLDHMLLNILCSHFPPPLISLTPTPKGP